MLVVLIHNDGTGTEDVGHYDVEVRINARTIAQGRVEDHDRALDWRALVRRVLEVPDVQGETWGKNKPRSVLRRLR